MPKLRSFSPKVKAASALLTLFIGPAWAGQTAHDEPSPDLVVTANRIGTESEKIGSAVTVINGDQIDRSQKKTVADILRTVPGLAVSQTGGAGRNTAIRIRGAESYHTKVIIDGVDVSDPSQSQPQYDFANLLSTNIDRIEVVRGPQSLLYGGDALGGVIAITTRKGQDGHPRADALAEIGSLHSYTAASTISGVTGRINYALGATHLESDGISAASRRTGNDENDPYRNDSITARLGAKLTDWWDVEASGRHVRAKVDYDDWTNRAVDDSDQMHSTERGGRLATNVSLLGGRFLNMLAVSASQSRRDIDAGASYWGNRNSFYDGDSVSWEYQGTVKLAPDNHTIVFGTELKRDSTEQDTLKRHVGDDGVYADYQFSPLDSLFLTLGGRVDDHDTFGSHNTGRGTAAYLIDATATRLHGSYGTGFRAPSLWELYHPLYGNQTLKPEKSRGWDFGVDQEFWTGRAGVDITWFDNRVQNLIQWRNNSYVNIASTRSQGAELAGHVDVTPAVRLNASYTFTDSRNNTTSQILARRPKHQGSLGMAWQALDDLTVDSTVRAIGRQYDSATGAYLGGFVTVDLAAAYRLTDWLTVQGRVENLLDKQYEEVDTYGTAGLMAYAGLKAAF